MICIVSCFQTILLILLLLLTSLLINHVYDSLLWIIIIDIMIHDVIIVINPDPKMIQNAWFQILIVTIISGSICTICLTHTRLAVDDESMISLDIYIYRGPEKDRKVISYSNSDRLLIYLFGILLISKSHNPSIMHQNLSSPVSERTKIKTREPSMSGPTSDGSKKNMENHWKITSFGNLRETIYKWVFPCQVWSVAWQSDTYEHLVQNLGHFSGLRSNPIWFTDSPFRS